ncbi:NHLP bacteriocin export ABC transporter permease/ATPase subunit [Candidatus Pseudoruminococcus sp.]|uniref:NHLP bacteriocin export ABC transporter permease/ATPase subunit n=1 Tax=Candidatus Pseudoruminococcus sp. TaxID=3101048 RepID=UPI00399A36B2
MGWFDEQIRERIEHDNEIFSKSMADMAGVVMGEKVYKTLNNERILAKNAIDEILKFYNIKSKELPDSIKNLNDQLEYLMRPSGIMRRMVNLEGTWYKDSIGAMIGFRKDDGTAVALIPNKTSGYSFFDSKLGKRIKVNRKNAKLIKTEAICFYKPFPLKEIGIKDLLAYILHTLSVSDIVYVIFAALAATFMGLLITKINKLIYSYIIETNSEVILIAIFSFLLCVMISQTLFNVLQSLIISRISNKMNTQVQAAGMMRLLSLPPNFFKKYSAGDLSERVSYIGSLCTMLTDSVMTAGLTSIFSLVYITQMAEYGPELVIPGLLVILITVAFSIITTFMQMKILRRRMEASAKESGLNYSLVTGVQKIKLAGAEKRAFAKWANTYKEVAKLTYDPPMLLKFSSVVSTAISLIGTIVIYYFTITTNVSLSDYYAFNSAYGMVMGAFSTLVSMAASFAQIKPMMEMIKPILQTVPEISENKQVVTKLSGGIELNNISFRYNERMPMVIDNLSLKIRPGQYVAIVGKTGCGKSTLMRLMLGFETPQKGAIYFDNKDISTLDLKSLRHHIGTVMQNSKLFQGDIYSNITISAPWLTLDDAWQAAEMSGIAEDIRNMPMEMHTVISEGSGGISGGQKQRLIIARAIAPKPKVLMFDEATSALDNITQKIVSDSLNSLKCTRIVIAHRLSTIKQCDRIIVLDEGKIIEDGKYDELIEKNGFFAELVARQRLDDK